MANVKNNAAAQETKRRLVEAAGEIFADVGFERATIKDITDRAGASIAAVNYHFSDKQELYYQVVRHAHLAGLNAVHTMVANERQEESAARLHTFVHTFLQQALDPNRPKWEAALIQREMREPTMSACERFTNEFLEPFVDVFGALVTDLAGRPTPSVRTTRLLIDSVLGQCLFYVYNQCKHARMYPDDPPSARVDELADHITRFSLAAIQCMRPFGASPATPPRAGG